MFGRLERKRYLCTIFHVYIIVDYEMKGTLNKMLKDAGIKKQ